MKKRIAARGLSGSGTMVPTYAIIGLTAFIMLAPLLWALLTAFKPNSEVYTRPYSINVATLSFHAFVDVFRSTPFHLYFLNTLIITVSCTIGVIATSSMAGYAFARLAFPGKNVIFALFIATMMIPRQVTLVPTFIIMRWLGLIDTRLSLIIPGILSVFGTFLMRQFFLTVPQDYEDAAKVDGCGVVRRFAKVMMPFAKSTVATLTLLTIMAVWNDYLYPLVFLNSEAKRTLTLGLALFRSEADIRWNTLMAGVIVSNLPILVSFLCAQKYVIKGVALSGLKG
jgi:multiple sugar transport system permease protein